MRKYLVSIFILLIAASIFVLIARSINGPTESDDALQVETEVEDVPTEDFSISDYFDVEFDDGSSNSTSDAGADFETCELLGETVKEGTVIFDSTCTSSSAVEE